MKYDFIAGDLLNITYESHYKIATEFILKSQEITEEYKDELKIVGGIMGLTLNRVDFNQPYTPMFVSSKGRSFDIIDLDEKMANHIFNVIEQRTDKYLF